MACAERQSNVAALQRAEQLMTSRPDSALAIIDSLMADSAAQTRHFRMQCRLHRRNAWNKLDTVFRSTDEPQALVSYFDEHGTPNEQMLAYYLLGRAYADMYEAPMAMHYYQEAVEKGDTTNEDCDFALLCRVFSQMADICYRQNLFAEDIRFLDLSIGYAYKAKDTIAALNSYAYKGVAYSKLGALDSTIEICNRVCEAFSRLNNQKSGQFSTLSFSALISRNRIDEAKAHLEFYERNSGYLDSNGNIEKGREIYYYWKGTLCYATNQYDSAEYYFRKELLDGMDFNNQNAASHGLAQLFQKIHKPDSAAKYALYSYTMNDSAYSQMSTEAVEQAKAMYDYTRNEEIAQKEKERADKRSRELAFICVVALAILALTGVIYQQYRLLSRKRKREQREYQHLQVMHEQARAELSQLREHEAEFQLLTEKLATQEQAQETILRQSEIKLNRIVCQKEAEAAALKMEISKFHQQEQEREQEINRSIISLNASPVYQALRRNADNGSLLTDDNWSQIEQMVTSILPEFHQFISSRKMMLNKNEYRTCLLTRLQITPLCIANLIGVSASYVSLMSKTILQKVFSSDGNNKDLYNKLKSLC